MIPIHGRHTLCDHMVDIHCVTTLLSVGKACVHVQRSLLWTHCKSVNREMILGAGGAGADLIRETLKESEAAGLEESKQSHHELPVGGPPPPLP